MKIEQIYTACLAQGSYYIRSGNEVAIVDPLREIDPYLRRAKDDNAQIKYIFETHFHADFVSGHITLAKATGATIVFGPQAVADFPIHVATDGEVFTLGNVSIKALHTPGHTLESACYLLFDEQGKEHGLFSGDTLFLGDVGRPDLVQKGKDNTKEEMAGKLYDSLQTHIMPLPDTVIIYPGHGAGSACGKNLMQQKTDTLGHQKEVNYALRKTLTKERFIKEVTDGLPVPPGYFPYNAKMNKQGYESTENVLEKALRPLSPAEAQTLAHETGTLILDVRTPHDFARAHIPKSLFIGLDGAFAPWVGELLVDVNTPLILVAPEGREKEAVTRLARIGFDNIKGYLKGGIDGWTAAGKEVGVIASVSADAFGATYGDETPVFDVRKDSEYELRHVIGAKNVPLNLLTGQLEAFPKEAPFYVHCAGGYRSMIAASLLKARGIGKPINIEGGFKAIEDTEIPQSSPQPSLS